MMSIYSYYLRSAQRPTSNPPLAHLIQSKQYTSIQHTNRIIFTINTATYSYSYSYSPNPISPHWSIVQYALKKQYTYYSAAVFILSIERSAYLIPFHQLANRIDIESIGIKAS